MKIALEILMTILWLILFFTALEASPSAKMPLLLLGIAILRIAEHVISQEMWGEDWEYIKGREDD